MDEKRYRALLDDAYARIDRAFEPVDPDVAEVQLEQGTLAVLYAGGVRLLVTPQPPLRQIWVAFRDRAWHFVHDTATGTWKDDRGQGVELFSLVERLTRETGGVEIRI